MRALWVAMLMCVSLAMVGCKKKLRQVVRAVSPVADAGPVDSRFVVDGMPPTEREWSAADMARAAAALTAISATDPAQLPRHGSAIFTRVTSTANLAVLGDESRPVDTRMMEATEYLESVNVINKLYLSAFTRGAVSPRESIAMMGALLRVLAAVVPASNAFMKSLPADDPKMAARLAGVDQMKAGFADVVVGVLLTLGERAFYPAADRLLLAGELRATLPVLRELLHDRKQRLATGFADLARDETVPELRALLSELASMMTPP